MALRWFLSLLCGVSMALAFEPYRLPVLLPLGIAGLVLLTRGAPVGRAAVVGLGFGVGYMYVHLFWMRAVGYDAWLALAGAQAVFFLVLGAGFAVVSRSRAEWVWYPLLYVAIEVLRGAFPFGGLPWGRLAFATIDTPWAASLPWVGPTLVSLLIATTGSLAAWVLVRWREEGLRATARPAAALGVAVVLTAVPVVATYDVVPERTVTVAAIQGNVPGDGSDILLDHRQVTRNHVDTTVELAEDVRAGRRDLPAFVVWPENSTAVDPFRDLSINSGIRTAAEAIGVPVLVGAIADGGAPDTVLNQGIVWDPRTGAGDRYTKRHPVPFGEYIPYRDRVFTRNFGRLDLIPRDMYSGTRVEPLRVGDVAVADAICFDVAYDDGIHAQLKAGGELLVVQTSNAMFIHTSQIEQQFAISRLRAIETGKYVVVAATNGVSGIIAPDGSVLERAGVRTRAALVGEVGLATGASPAVTWGAWPGRAVVLLAAAGVLWGLIPYRRRGRVPAAHPAVDAEVPVP
ncbi:apolipoprotein N-acyltransferase [Nocardioides sp.]|uniref:apolipoprotein N-acyltransferase n=1 Tax=Nocardioides sp. TaxID=35761 RepID=UPI002734C0D7|nr:apolipoprotein N-acyltransferase [Nocardioides sp.]MDP3893559.1 apolipoprotein N-acyltransferase [Nocardioides sp.]